MSEYTCRECDHRLIAEDEDGGMYICCNTECSRMGVPIPLTRLLDPAEQVPAGWPRPTLEGRPVPWVTPVRDGAPA